MKLFQINLLLAGGWCALFGTFDLGTFVWGFLLAFAALSLSSPVFGQTAYFKRVLLSARLGAYFLYELTVSGLQVAWDVITPAHRSRPAIVAVPLDLEEPIQITVLAPCSGPSTSGLSSGASSWRSRP